jgi:triacylglycerol esterase/lipase EstA (alpha/beta hydrolase family)
LEARYLISTLGMSDQVASLTTIACPHHGSKTMDFVCKLPNFLFLLASVFINLWFRILGDQNPDFQQVCKQFTTYFTEEFNQQNKDAEGVYYQSYAAVMKNSFSDFMMIIPHFVICRVEGENDGLVTPRSAEWTNFKGILRGSTNRGISHADEVDMRRRKLSNKTQADCVQDICDVYLKIIRDLKQQGL